MLPLTVLAASLLGSAHCAGMCGGLLAATSKTWRERAAFHGGRGVAYATLGFLAGAFGQGVAGEAAPVWLSFLAAGLYSVTLVVIGARLLSRRPMHFGWPVFWPLKKLRAHGDKLWARALAGALIPLLPCGWLYMFVLGAASSGSGLRGAILLAVFWAGTLPALEVTNFGIQKMSRQVGRRLPRLGGMLLIVAGVISLCAKFY